MRSGRQGPRRWRCRRGLRSRSRTRPSPRPSSRSSHAFSSALIVLSRELAPVIGAPSPFASAGAPLPELAVPALDGRFRIWLDPVLVPQPEAHLSSLGEKRQYRLPRTALALTAIGIEQLTLSKCSRYSGHLQQMHIAMHCELAQAVQEGVSRILTDLIGCRSQNGTLIVHPPLPKPLLRFRLRPSFLPPNTIPCKARQASAASMQRAALRWAFRPPGFPKRRCIQARGKATQ